MRPPQTAAAFGAATALLVAVPAAAVGEISGASASSYEAGCRPHGTAMDFSGSCSATYTGHAGTVTSALVSFPGIAGTRCGTITISGETTSAAYVCGSSDTWFRVAFNALVAPSGFTVSWGPDDSIGPMRLHSMVCACI